MQTESNKVEKVDLSTDKK